MKLSKLLKGTGVISFPSDIEITGIAIDSRQVRSGDIFICLSGGRANGDDYAREALSKGARAIVSEKSLPFSCAIKVEDARAAYALISKNFYGRACDKMKIIGVTGTNGKTTVVDIITQILNSTHRSAASIGTLGVKHNKMSEQTGFTTPDPHILHEMFYKLWKEGVEYVVMEVSAHALALKKLEGVNFEVGILTNISQDHLDFFKDMTSYAEAKYSFFESGRVKTGIFNIDDELVRIGMLGMKGKKITYSSHSGADIFSSEQKLGFLGSEFLCAADDKLFAVKTNLVGQYNIQNTLAAVAACRAIGLDEKEIAGALRFVAPTEGRFNVVSVGGSRVIIDYAHTPDGMEKVLSAVRALTKGKVICVFGCGGERDKAKRPLMGKVASKYSDKVIITSDNPRGEEPIEIINSIARGASGDYEKIENRHDATFQALSLAKEGDSVVILGKGGEKWQEIKGEKLPYNDFDTVYEFYRGRIALKSEEKKCF